MSIQLESISKVMRESLIHANSMNTQDGKSVFSKEQMEIICEATKAAFSEYHRQVTEGTK